MTLDLTTHYGGLALVSPIIAGACPLMASEQTRVALVAAGAGAIVLPSLFEEHVIRWSKRIGRTLTAQEQELLARANQSQTDELGMDTETYLSAVNRASSQLPIPVIASLNGYVAGGWVDFAGELQEAGAAAIELNIHPAPPKSYDGPREIEESVIELVCEVNAAITIPLFVKFGRDYTSMPHIARRLLSGVSGMVLYGRSPDVDICLDTLELKSQWGLTPSGSIIQTLNKIMQVHAYCPAMSLAACGGIGTSEDVAKSLLAGADVAMVTSAIYRDGPDAVRTLNDGLRQFMNQHQMMSIGDLQLQRPLEFATDEERVAYMTALTSKLEADQTHDGGGTMSGDRWGHPTSTSE